MHTHALASLSHTLSHALTRTLTHRHTHALSHCTHSHTLFLSDTLLVIWSGRSTLLTSPVLSHMCCSTNVPAYMRWIKCPQHSVFVCLQLALSLSFCRSHKPSHALTHSHHPHTLTGNLTNTHTHTPTRTDTHKLHTHHLSPSNTTYHQQHEQHQHHQPPQHFDTSLNTKHIISQHDNTAWHSTQPTDFSLL